MTRREFMKRFIEPFKEPVRAGVGVLLAADGLSRVVQGEGSHIINEAVENTTGVILEEEASNTALGLSEIALGLAFASPTAERAILSIQNSRKS